jgi:glycosyltransferase involved in cell wall biosynthesis
MKIAYIRQPIKRNTGADQLNNLIIKKLREKDFTVKNVCYRSNLKRFSKFPKIITKKLSSFCLLKNKISTANCDLVQGSTYLPLEFLSFKKTIISHFGSTYSGYLKSTPLTKKLKPNLQQIWTNLKKSGVFLEMKKRSRKSVKDKSNLEVFVAKKVSFIIATSQKVKEELIKEGVDTKKIKIIFNAIEDSWFKSKIKITNNPKLVFLGRLGQDAFTLKLKGLDRLIDIFYYFPKIDKITITMTESSKLVNWLKNNIKGLSIYANYQKEKIKKLLSSNAGSILLITSRYEGFSLSLIEGMSQGLIPIVWPVGIAPEIIKNGINGFIVNNQKEAKEKIKFILENDNLRKKMAKNSWKTANLFTTENMINQLTCLYNEIIPQK